MRILHVITTRSGIGGAERVMEWLVRGAAQHGAEAAVLNPGAVVDAELGRVLDGAWHPLSIDGPFSLARTSLRFRRSVAAFRPDVVHAHLPGAAALVAFAGDVGVPRVLSHQHGDHYVQTGRRVLERLDRTAGMRFDAVVGCSRFVERFLQERYRYDSSRTRTIRNGWSGTPLPPRRADRPTVVCVANFRAQKRHDLLLEAFSVVRRSVPSARLVLVGSGPLEAEVRERARRLGLRDAVEFAGSAADVWDVLATAWVFALASSYEPLGIVAFEALAAQVPVVAFDVGGLNEAVEDAVTGHLLAFPDVGAMAGAITSLLGDDVRRRRMGVLGAHTAARHTADTMVRDYYGLYRELVEAR